MYDSSTTEERDVEFTHASIPFATTIKEPQRASEMERLREKCMKPIAASLASRQIAGFLNLQKQALQSERLEGKA